MRFGKEDRFEVRHGFASYQSGSTDCRTESPRISYILNIRFTTRPLLIEYSVFNGKTVPPPQSHLTTAAHTYITVHHLIPSPQRKGVNSSDKQGVEESLNPTTHLSIQFSHVPTHFNVKIRVN